jgi:DNA polymerase III epsilon subunit-like protein
MTVTTPRPDDIRVRLLRGNRFFVACDTETTGRTADARVLSVAFVEMLSDGLVGEGATWFFNPGVRSHPDAARVNRITPEHLRGRAQFVKHRV